MGACSAYANAHVGESYGFAVSWFSVQVAILCVVGVVVIFVSLIRTLREELFPLYLGYLLFTAFAFTLQAIQEFFPLSTVQPYYGITQCIKALTIAMQWFVHTSTVMYLLERNPGTVLPRRVILCAWRLFVLCCSHGGRYGNRRGHVFHHLAHHLDVRCGI